VRLVTTYVGTMHASHRFGPLARAEAERRRIRQAWEVVVMGGGAAWLHAAAAEHFGGHPRILDFYHVDERLGNLATALCPGDARRKKRLADRLESQCWEGQVGPIIRWLQQQAKALGPPRQSDPAEHPRQVIAEHRGYLQRHQGHRDYPRYRAQGWPIGSGVTASELFNQRVKGTDQFWNESGVEAMLALRLSQDDRRHHYWLWGRRLRAVA
jgi:hypothetical protein